MSASEGDPFGSNWYWDRYYSYPYAKYRYTVNGIPVYRFTGTLAARRPVSNPRPLEGADVGRPAGRGQRRRGRELLLGLGHEMTAASRAVAPVDTEKLYRSQSRNERKSSAR